jgi:hypothetical protein
MTAELILLMGTSRSWTPLLPPPVFTELRLYAHNFHTGTKSLRLAEGSSGSLSPPVASPLSTVESTLTCPGRPGL